MKTCTTTYSYWHTFPPVNCLLKIKTIWNVTYVRHWNDTTGTHFMQRMSLDHSPWCFTPGYYSLFQGYTAREDALHSFSRSAAGPGGSARRANATHWPLFNIRPPNAGPREMWSRRCPWAGQWSPRDTYAAARGLRGGKDVHLDLVHETGKRKCLLLSRKLPRVITCELAAEGGLQHFTPSHKSQEKISQ